MKPVGAHAGLVLDDHGDCGAGVVAIGDERPIGQLRAAQLMAELNEKFSRERYLAEYRHLPIRQVAELPVGPRPREIPGTVEHVYSVDAYMRRSEALHSKRWLPTQSKRRGEDE